MACQCSELSPYQRLSLAWNEVMNLRQDLDERNFAAATNVLTAIDALMMRLETAVRNDPLPLYTSLCKHEGKCDAEH